MNKNYYLQSCKELLLSSTIFCIFQKNIVLLLQLTKYEAKEVHSHIGENPQIHLIKRFQDE